MNKQAFFITATNTDTGKTFTTASLLKTFLETGHEAVAIKPLQSGAVMDEATGVMVSPDVVEFQKVSPKNHYPSKYALPFPSSPHYAASREGIQIHVDEICLYCKKYMDEHQITLIEGA